MAAGILAEIDTIDTFKDNDAFAKYAGIVWRESQSGNFKAEDTTLSKAGNAYLRYYILEATSHIKNNCIEINVFYKKKYAEVKTHQHKRTLALAFRKVIRLIFGLLAKHQIYSGNRVDLKRYWFKNFLLFFKWKEGMFGVRYFPEIICFYLKLSLDILPDCLCIKINIILC